MEVPFETRADVPMSETWDADYQRRLGKIKNILAPQSKQPTKPDSLHINGWGF